MNVFLLIVWIVIVISSTVGIQYAMSSKKGSLGKAIIWFALANVSFTTLMAQIIYDKLG